MCPPPVVLIGLRNTQCCYIHRKCAFGQRSRGKSVTRWQEDREALQEIRKILWKVEDQENIRTILWKVEDQENIRKILRKVKDMVNIPGEFFKTIH